MARGGQLTIPPRGTHYRLEDRVDADGVDPVFVKQLAGRIEQPIPGRPGAGGVGAHTSNLQTGLSEGNRSAILEGPA